jgi:hypothetical protein
MTKSQKKYFCYNCNSDTLQTELISEIELYPSEITGRNEDGSKSDAFWVIQGCKWLLLKCNGCERINLKRILAQVGTEENTTIDIPSKIERQVPKWCFELPIDYTKIILETYAAINHGLFRLAASGARTTIDVFILDKIGDKGTFVNKLNTLVQEGFLSEQQKKTLNSALDAGSAAIHRGYEPDKETINDIMDIIEHLLHQIILLRKAERLEDKTPKREKN